MSSRPVETASAIHAVLSAVQAPFTYEARPPADISFVPLKQQQEFTAEAVLQVRTLYADAPDLFMLCFCLSLYSLVWLPT